MRILLLLFCLPGFVPVISQEYKDTTFITRDFTCTCKYNVNPEDDKRIFDHTAAPASYPGGVKEWDKFVKKNMDKGLKGKHPVQLRFEVDKNGDLSSFILLNKAPVRKYEEVVRLLQSSGKWFPSVQKGFCVKSYVSLSFEL